MHEQTKDPPGTRRIPLTRGMFALVDEANYGWLSKRKWRAFRAPNNRVTYAITGPVWFNGRRSTLYMHRCVLMGTTRVDHINSNGLDNRIANLREANPTQSLGNTRKRRTTAGKQRTSSHYKGVSWSKERNGWWARLNVNRKAYLLGVFGSEEEAARAYDAAARLYFGEFARTNFKGESS